MTELLLDEAGRRPSPATLPEFHAARSPRNKGIRYAAAAHGKGDRRRDAQGRRLTVTVLGCAR